MEINGGTGATGIEPAIFGLTGRRVNHYTTPPRMCRMVANIEQCVKLLLNFLAVAKF